MARMPLVFVVLVALCVGCASRPKAVTEVVITRQPGCKDVKAEIHFKLEAP